MGQEGGGNRKRSTAGPSGRCAVPCDQSGVLSAWQKENDPVMKLRTVETDPILVMGEFNNGAQTVMSTTVYVQVRVFGRWLTLLKYDRIC